MARNIPVALTDSEYPRVQVNRPLIMAALSAGKAVTFTYTKPDGSVSSRTLHPATLSGVIGMSTEAVRGDTPDGERSFNLRSMHNLTILP